jgi:hypothetical protein
VAACESCQGQKLVLSDRYKNKVNIVPLKYLYRLRGCVRPLRVVPPKNICFVLLARPCFRYSCVYYFFTIFVIHQKNWHRYHTLYIICNCYSRMGYSGMGYSGMGYSEMGYSGMGYSGMGYSGMGYSGTGYSGIGYSGIGYSGMGYSGIGYSGMGYSGMGYSGIG